MTAIEYKTVPTAENHGGKPNDSKGKASFKYGYGVRHIQAFICFICLSIGFLSSGHLGVTIVAMTMVRDMKDIEVTQVISDNGIIAADPAIIRHRLENFTAINDLNHGAISANNVADKEWSVYKTYEWPKFTQEIVLGSFFVGCLTAMLPMGLVSQRWGGKIPLQISMFFNGAASFVSPWAVLWGGWKTLCVLRFLQGASQSGVYPGINTLLSNWVPANERASLSSFVFTSSGVGSMIAFQLGGIIAFSRLGWPGTFWVIGAAGIMGFVLVTVFCARTPEEHKSITKAEKLYITGNAEHIVETKARVPWKRILRTAPVWATITAQVGNSMCFMFFFMQIPTYMFSVLKVDIISSGILTSLPYLASCFSSISFGYLSDYLTNRQIIEVKTARRLFNCIASVIPAICLTSVAYTTNTVVAVMFFIIFVTANAGIHTGWMVNYMDLSPNFSGALFATGNTAANIFVVMQPLIVSAIITDVTDQHQWKITMFLMSAITFGANIIFYLFMSVDVQPWNDDEDQEVKTV